MNLLRLATAAWAFIICLVLGVAVGSSYSGRTTGPTGLHPTTEILFATGGAFKTVITVVAVIFALIALPGWFVFRLYMRWRPTRKPEQLALEDPWVRAKLAGMTEQERADVLQKLKE
jgi:hypothetical protein